MIELNAKGSYSQSSQRAKQLAAVPVFERIKRRVRRAADEVEAPFAQLFVGLGDGIQQFELGIEKAELDGGDQRKVRRRNEIGNRHFHLMPAA